MSAVPHTTRLVLRAIGDLTALESALKTKVKGDRPGETLKIRKVLIDVSSLIGELENMAEKVQGKSGTSLDEAKSRLKKEAQKRRSGQLKSKGHKLCVGDHIPEGIKKSADHEGAMVAFFLTPKEASSIAVPGGEPAKDLHVTLVYFEDKGSDRSDWDKAAKVVEGIAQQHDKLVGNIAGHGRFTNDGSHVCWASVDVPGLDGLRHDLVDALEAAGFPIHQEHSYTPHITLKYLQPKEEDPCNITERLPLHFDSICLTVAEHRQMFELK